MGLLIGAAAFKGWQGPTTTRLEVFECAKVLIGSTTARQTIDRGGLSFPLLFVASPGQPVSLCLDLGKTTHKGPCALWMYTARADDHCTVRVVRDGDVIGTLRNRDALTTGVPRLTLSKVGDICLDDRDLGLVLTCDADSMRFFAELALVILAAPALSEQEVMELLMTGGPTASPDFFLTVAIVALVILLSAVTFHVYRYSSSPLRVSATTLLPMLVSLVFISVLLRDSVVTWLPPYGRQNVRSGLDSMIDAATFTTMQSLKAIALKHLPSRQVEDKNDAVPRTSEGSFSSRVFLSSASTPRASIHENLLGGVLAYIQGLPQALFVRDVAVLAVLTGFATVATWMFPWCLTMRLPLSLLATLSVYVSIRASEGWDEFYVNLRHADILLRHGVYSINANEMVEASVDFLPLVLTALIGTSGIPLPDAFIVMSLLGNVLIVPVCFYTVRYYTQDPGWSLAMAALVALHPNVVAVGATGFTAVLFTSWLLAAAYLFLVQRNFWIGATLLGTLTFVRTEGILFAALLTAISVSDAVVKWLRDNSRNTHAIFREVMKAGVTISPFIVTLVIRHALYGSAIPTPVVFKNTSGDRYYAATGIDTLLGMIQTHDVHISLVLIGICGVALTAARRYRALDQRMPRVRSLLAAYICISVFILPYFIGGGDWFPPRWNRYGMPLTVGSIIVLGVLYRRLLMAVLPKPYDTYVLCLTAGLLAAGYIHSIKARVDNVLIQTLNNVAASPTGRWQRIDNLASLGLWLRSVLPQECVVACPEEATIMYYSQHNMLGLLGISTPEISRMPLQPMRAGDVMHRRRALQCVAGRKPAVILLWEPFFKSSALDGRNRAGTIKSDVQSQCFSNDHCSVAYYRVGSFGALHSLGYQHITVCHGDQGYSLFVHQSILATLSARLLADGCVEVDPITISYWVDPSLVLKYRDGLTESSPGEGG